MQLLAAASQSCRRVTGAPAAAAAAAAPAGEVTPNQALRKACDDLKQVCSHVDGVMDQALAKFKLQQPRKH
jgi:hypothetical protein